VRNWPIAERGPKLKSAIMQAPPIMMTGVRQGAICKEAGATVIAVLSD
jgi:hypothetical protein